jgi:hypothetical protein
MGDKSGLADKLSELDLSDGNTGPDNGKRDICPWYYRPETELEPFSNSANVWPETLCYECRNISVSRFIGTPGSREYTFEKTYRETCVDASCCALCRAIEDSIRVSRLYPGGQEPSLISPTSHVRLVPKVNRSWKVFSSWKRPGHHVPVATMIMTELNPYPMRPHFCSGTTHGEKGI